MTEISELIAENVPIILIQLFDLVSLLYTFTSTFIPQRRRSKLAGRESEE